MNLPTNNIIKFWFNDSKTEMFNFWFNGEKDDCIKENYKNLVDNIDINNYKSFINNDMDKIALLLVGDQFTRNIYRNSNERLKNDTWTLELALNMLNNNEDYNYNLNMRYFILLPLRHNKSSKLLNIVRNRILSYV